MSTAQRLCHSAKSAGYVHAPAVDMPLISAAHYGQDTIKTQTRQVAHEIVTGASMYRAGKPTCRHT